jgi:lipid-binding SYLF domain-containing protein
VQALKALLAWFLALCCTACVWRPVTYTEAARDAADGAIAAFRESGELQRYFEEAVAYAVFPASVRAGTGLGGAYGNGWLFEDGEVTGRVVLVEFFAGADLGAQSYRSILFFRNHAALQRFRRGRFEFTGQANATVITAGKSLTPSYATDVAMFVQVRGGLLLEASVGAQRYDYFPLVTTPATSSCRLSGAC